MTRKMTIEEIAGLVGGRLSGAVEGSDKNSGASEIYRVSDLENAAANEIAFVEKKCARRKYKRRLFNRSRK